MKKFRLFLLMLSAAVLPFTACQTGGEGVDGNGDGNGDPTPPAGPTVVEFYADATTGSGELLNAMSTTDTHNVPGHMFYVASSEWNEETQMSVPNGGAMLVLLDYDFQQHGCESYSYLTAHHYPMVAGGMEEGNIPTTSCVVVDPAYAFFEVNGVEYTIVMPESATDANGRPYGVEVAVSPATTQQDLSQLYFYLPAVDKEGNSVVIDGQYVGNLGYVLGNVSTGPENFNMSEWGFTAFESTKEGDVVTLKSNSQNGELVFNFDTSKKGGELTGNWVVGNGLTGYWFRPGLPGEEATFELTAGNLALESTATAGIYTLIAGSREGSYLTMTDGNLTYQFDHSVDYTITVTGETDSPSAEVTVVEFYADATTGSGELLTGMSTTDTHNVPGHMFYVASSEWNEETQMSVPNGGAMLVLLDYDFQQYGCESYSYLTSHHYPMVAGGMDEGNIPTTSCVVVDPAYAFFEVNGVEYTIVMPESATDANDQPYGVEVYEVISQGMGDLSMLLFNLPAVDKEGNNVVIQGSYTGPLGYKLSGGATQTSPFNLNDFGYTTYTATKEGNLVTLRSTTYSGDMVFTFDTTNTNGEILGNWVVGEGLTGYYFEAGLDEKTYNLNAGRLSIAETTTPGQYTLIVGSKEGSYLTMSDGKVTYQFETVDYTITVTGLE